MIIYAKFVSTFSTTNLKDFCKKKKKRNSEKIEVHFRIRKRMNCTEIWGEGKKRGLFFGYPNNNIKEVLKF